MASNGTPPSDGRSGAGLGASPGGALGSSQGVGPAGRAADQGVDQGVSPADQGIDSGVLTSGSTVSPATHGMRFYSDQGARIGDMSGRQGPSLRTQHVGGAAGPQSTETNLVNWSPQATITAQNLNYQGAESVGPRLQEDAEAAALRGLLLDYTRQRNESLLPERLQQSYEPFRAEVGQATLTLRQQVEATERLVRQQEAAEAEQAEEAELRRRLQAATEALAVGGGDGRGCSG